MNCNNCHLPKTDIPEDLIQDVVDYLRSVGVTKESMIATLAYMGERSKYLNSLPTPHKFKEDSNEDS